MVKYSEEIKIRGHYTDLQGRLIVKSLCDLFNDVANGQTLLLGFDVPTLNAQGLTWMLHKLRIIVNRMPEQEEIVTLETWPSGIDRLFALRDFSMFSGKGELLIRATSEWMVIDINRRRPVRLPACVTGNAASCVDVVREIPFELDTKNMPEEYENSRCFTATYDNIDFNKHVTQATYVRWVTNSLSYVFLKEHGLRELEIVYEHEVLPDSRVNAENHVTEDDGKVKVYHRVRNEAGDKTHCFAVSTWEKNLD
ncbi:MULTISPECIES: acyl-[acyl-carrier-protein] thioesterase [Butyricimonas]|uniref:acyl-[acyl-carrier-protein] thioesterase n=1 Tax=Butyricimonas TaxID=574697 RepID=UPI001D099DF7|nr:MULTISPECIES: acyl-ACP thioesterase domain-containing protein [Butyricimonas]MCB6974881.1 acyl-ACP thioesterase [Butyricimonas synergistica]MCG4521634.1 thioesterase [Butyricimonas sp. DFI.6.44]